MAIQLILMTEWRVTELRKWTQSLSRLRGSRSGPVSNDEFIHDTIWRLLLGFDSGVTLKCGNRSRNAQIGIERRLEGHSLQSSYGRLIELYWNTVWGTGRGDLLNNINGRLPYQNRSQALIRVCHWIWNYIGLPDSIGIGSCVSTTFDTMESIIPKASPVQRRSPMGIFGRNSPMRI